MFIIDFIELSS